MTNFKLLFCASLSLLASGAHGTSPIMPYIPAEAFKYRCQVKVVAYSYNSKTHRPARQYTSTAEVEFDNKQQWAQGEGQKWTHFYAESNPNMPFMPKGNPVAQSPHVKDISIGIRFDYPSDQGVVDTTLTAMIAGKQADKFLRSDSQAFATFTDTTFATKVGVSEYSDLTGQSTSKELTVRCEKI